MDTDEPPAVRADEKLNDYFSRSKDFWLDRAEQVSKDLWLGRAEQVSRFTFLLCFMLNTKSCAEFR